MRSEKLNENAIHELEVVDAVVRGGGHARPEDAALTDFALLVRNARPLPDHGAELRLDERLIKQHPARRESRRPLITALATLALVIAVGGAALNAERGGDDSTSLPASADMAAPSAAPEGAAIEGSAAGQAMSVAPNPSTEQALAKNTFDGITQQRAVARDARLTLATPGNRLESLSDKVIETVDGAGGYVASSEVRTADGERGRAEFLLMLKADSFQETFKELSRLAHVRSRSQSTEDITAQSNSAKRTVEQRQKRIDQLEARLAAADTAPERASIQRQLNRAKFALRQAQRDVRANSIRVRFVPVELKVVADNSAATADQGAIGKAVDRAGEILTGIAAVLIVVLAVGLPIALVAALVYAGYRRWHRGRANRAIGEAAVQPE